MKRLAHGVYIAVEAHAEDPIGQHLQQARAFQLISPLAIASHHTAALAWGLDVTETSTAALAPPTFIVPTEAGVRSGPTATARLHARTLPVHHRVTLPSGLNVTSLARTAVDIAAATPELPDALVSLDAFARSELAAAVGDRGKRRAYTQPQRLAACREPLHEAARTAATQFTRAWLATVLPMADPRRESALESLSYGRMESAGFPTPQLQAPIVTPLGEFWVDFLWAGQMVIGEADGEFKYRNDPDALLREKRRQEALEQMGFIVVRWTYKELARNPGAVLARIMRALESRS